MKPISKTTIDDVAELAGVSIKTVSRVVNHEPNVRDSTRDKVEKAITKLNYRPNLSARSLASHRSHIIVLVYDDPSAYELPSAGYVTSMQEGALRACRAADCELLIHPCNYRDKNVAGEIRALIGRARPDGVVLAAPLSNMQKIVSAITATNTLFVELSPGKKNGKQLSVVTNDREISAEMTRYLASLGHKRIAFITGHPRHKAVGNRFKGYQDGLEQSGLTFSEQLVIAGDNSFGSGESCATKLLARKRPPTAVFAANDDMAAGVIRAADRLGVAVPAQLSVAGFDDIALARQIYPALTTIRQPLAAMAEKAALALVGESKQRTEIVPATLQIRESTGPAPK
ncbi:MAG: LacI family DNA-binding transcriptional regulator [Gammaproteobacteria bacterium]|nr:LacI family DNA-binding transcriptional regulator [Gammaproteobacteria bacterium]MDH3553305.1 LacI family DNA-binding transcriptional regulator [Gammaproteobacteria bacterium]